MSDILKPFGLLRRPDAAAFALLALVVPWISLFAPRVLGGVLPVAAILALGGRYWTHRAFPPMSRGPWIAAALVVALCAVSGLWAPDGLFALDRASRIAGSLAAALLLFYTAAGLAEEDRASLRSLLLWSAVFGLALIAVNMLGAGAIYRLVASKKALEAGAEVGTNRPMVVFVLVAWPAVVAGLESGRRRLALLLPFAAFAVTTLTESQTAFTAAIFGIGVCWIARNRPRFAGLAVAWGGAALILAMPGIVLLLRHLDPTIELDWPQASAGARLEIWYAIAPEVLRAPILGHGVEATRFVADWGMAHRYFPESSVLHPHNGALQIWYEFGAVGALFAAGLWVAATRRVALRKEPVRAAALACMVTVLVVSCVSHGLWQSWWLGAVGLLPALFVLVGKKSESVA